MHTHAVTVAQSRFREFVRRAITRDSEKKRHSVSQSVIDHRVYYVNMFKSSSPFTVRGPNTELSAGRMDPRVGSRFCRNLACRVGSALRIFQFLLIISWCLIRYESSNTTFGLINLL